MKILNKFYITLIIFISIVLPPLSVADDVEVYLGATTNTVGVQPNVLFILDTSGSMGWQIGNGDPTIRMVAMKQAMTEILGSVNNINVGFATFNGRGGPIRWPVRDIDAPLNLVEGFQVVRNIANGNDDSQEIDNGAENGLIDLTNEKIYLSEGPALSATISSIEVPIATYTDILDESLTSGAQFPDFNEFWVTPSFISGMRFQNIPLNQGAEIIDAKVNMRAAQASSLQDTTITITGEDADDASPINAGLSTLDDMFDNDATASRHTWKFQTGYDPEQEVYTDNISHIIEEIIGRAGWANANALNLLFKSDNQGQFYGYGLSSSGANAAFAPTLQIDYVSNPGTGPARRLTGLRFQDVRIPQGATITEAYISVKSAETSNTPADFTIRSELATDSSAFSTNTNDISSRATSVSSTAWNLTATDEWEAGERYQSPNIASVVQQVVNQNTWCGGNALTLMIEDTASVDARTFYSFEGANDIINDVPTLEVKYDLTGITPSETGCTLKTITKRIEAGDDDVEQNNSGGSVQRTSNDLDVGQRYVGLVFNGISLPQGANILSANLEFTARGQNSNSTSATIYGEDVDTATKYSGNTSYQVSERINNRPTANTVAWNNIPSATSDETYLSPDISSIVQEIVNRPGWSSSNNMALLLTGNSGQRSYYSYNDSPTQAARLIIEAQVNLDATTIEGETVRDQLISEVNSLVASGGTPITDVLYESIQYFRGDDVDWGKERGWGSWWARVSHPDSYENETGVYRQSNCTDSNLDHSSCWNEEIQGPANYISPLENACQSNYIVLLTDGSQNSFYGETKIENLIGDTCSGNGVNNDNNCGFKLAEYASTNDLSVTGPVGSNALTGTQSAKIYTIGFTQNASPWYMSGLAERGGGTYYQADSASELVNVFQQITADIASQPSTFTAPSLSVNAFNQLYSTKDVYVSLFEPSLNQRWDGNIKKYQLCTNDTGAVLICDAEGKRLTNGITDSVRDDAVSFWSPNFADPDGPNITLGGAGNQIQDPSSRTIYTYTGASQPSNVDLSLNQHLLAKSNSNLTAATFGVGSDAEKDDLIDWIRGEAIGGSNDSAGPTVNSRWAYADALHSAAAAVTYGGTVDDQIDKLLVGTNDGFIRMINTYNGLEEWAFMPQQMLDRQTSLQTNNPGDRIYGIDGTPAVWRNDKDQDGIIEPADGDFLKAFIGMRRGGTSYYALDITPNSAVINKSAINNITPELMWRIDGGSGDFIKMGQSWSVPLLAKIAFTETVNGSPEVVEKTVLVISGGYDDANDISVSPSNIGNAIYFVDPDTGERLWWISNSGSGANVEVPGMDYSIPSEVALLDMDLDGVQDRMVVGDVGGNIWRIDLLNDMVAKNSSVKGAIAHRLASFGYAQSPADNTAHRRFMYPPSVILNEGSVDLTNSADSIESHLLVLANTGNRAAPSSATIQDHMYGIKDYDIDSYTDANNDGLADGATTTTVGNLTDVSNALFGASPTGNNSADISNNNDGWYFPLNEDDGSYIGEKAISGGTAVKTGDPNNPYYYVFSTYFPAGAKTGSSTPCGTTLGSSQTYVLGISAGEVEVVIEPPVCENCAPPPPCPPGQTCETFCPEGECTECTDCDKTCGAPGLPDCETSTGGVGGSSCAAASVSILIGIGQSVQIEPEECFYPSYWITE